MRKLLTFFSLLFLFPFAANAVQNQCLDNAVRSAINAPIEREVFKPTFIANPDNTKLPNTHIDQAKLKDPAFKQEMGEYYRHIEKMIEIDTSPKVLMGSMEFGRLKLGDQVISNQVGGLGVVINDMVNSYPNFLKSRGDGAASFVFPGAKEIPHGDYITEFKIKMGDKVENVKVERFKDENGADIYFFRHPVFEARSINAKPSGIYQVPEGSKFSERPEWEEAYFFGLFNKSIKELHEFIGSNIYHGHDHHTAIAAQHIGKDTPAAVTIHNAGLGYEGRSWANGYGPGRISDEKYPQGVPNGPKEDIEKLLEYHGVDFDTYMKYYEDRGDFISLNAVKFVGDHNLISGSPVSLGYTDELKMDVDDLFLTVHNESKKTPLNPSEIYRPNGGRDLGNIDGVQNGLGANKHATIHPELGQKSLDEIAKLHEEIKDPKVKDLWLNNDLHFGKDLNTPTGQKLVHEKKAILKEMLQRTAGLEVTPNKPIFTLVSRIVDQKNVDVLAQNVRLIVENGGQVVIAGLPGDAAGKAVALQLEKLQNESELLKNNFKYFNTFANNGLGTLVQGGGDYFVITSKFEPSGLTDIESAWLGNIPLTRKTGGLGKVKNSLTYDWADSSDLAGEVKALSGTIDEAIRIFKSEPERFKAMRIAGMQEDFAWDISYSKYYENYRTSSLFKLVSNLEDDVASGRISLEQAEELTQKVIERLPDDMIENYARKTVAKDGPTELELKILSFTRQKIPHVAKDIMPTGPPKNEHLFNAEIYGPRLVKSQAGSIQGAFLKAKFPGAKKIELVSSFDEWREGIHFLEQNKKTGEWSIYVDNMKPGSQYKFKVIDSEGKTTYIVDPLSQKIERDSSGNYLNSVLADQNPFAWTDEAYTPNPFKSVPLSVNPDTYVSGNHNINYKELAAQIINDAKAQNKDSVSLVNLQGRELLKAGNAEEFSLFVPNPNHGTTEDFKFLVNELHKNKINVLMDMSEIVKPSALSKLSQDDFLKLKIESTKHLAKEFHLDGIHYPDLTATTKSELTLREASEINRALKEANPKLIIASSDSTKALNEDKLGLTARITDDSLDYLFDREKMIAFIKETGMPAYLKSTAHGDVPVVLVTKETYPKVKEIMENSYGALASLHPQNPTDHGWLRDGAVIMDLYNPSERHLAGGEFHETGLAWKTTDEYFSRRKQGSKTFFDQVFPLKKEELQDIDYLHRVRRAAFYRNPYAFYTDANGRSYMNTYFYDKGGRETASHVKPHMLKNCSGEHCYSYPLLQHASEQVGQMKSELKELGIHYDDVSISAPLKTLQDMIKEDVLAANAFDPDTFHFSVLLDKPQYREQLAKIWPGQHSKDDTLKALSFISSIPAVEDHNKLLNVLRDGSQQTFPYTDFSRKKSTVFFVYDEDPSAPQRFWDATYTNKGPQNSLNAEGNKKIE